ncbi:MAG: AlpA family phage regulatory protein [Deltaproteobacteria bacterium]
MDRLLTLRDVEHFTGFRKSSLYSLIADKRFPPPIKIGRSSRWPSSEISDWVQETIQRSRAADRTKEVA